MIEAENIYKSYTVARTRLQVLKGAGLSVAGGERVGVVGKSGAGKSTLLHILGTLDAPDEGSVTIGGVKAYAVSERARAAMRAGRIGFVFQSYHLLPEMDVLENVMLPAMAAGARVGSSETRARGMELLEAVGLAGRVRHTPLQLSGGEQQRVALARALMNGPEVVLADEPTGNLDDQTGRQVLDYLFSLTGDGATTLLLVTHDKAIAERCDRMLKLEDGRITPA